MTVEIVSPGTGLLDVVNQRSREALLQQLQRIVPLGVGAVLPSVGILGPGTYNGATLSGIVNLTGIGNPIVKGETAIAGTAMLHGITFNNTVRIRSTATAQFSACTFLLPVVVDAGGRVCCTGGRFDGTSAILNVGAAANAASVGNVKTSTVPHVNATIAIEV